MTSRSLDATWEQHVTDVLRIVVPHWGSHTLDIQDACNLLQVSSRCRDTLQQARGQFHVALYLDVYRPAAGLAQLIGFSACSQSMPALYRMWRFTSAPRHLVTGIELYSC